jgi:tRNA (mo5U34)-methyltransferase
MDRAALQARIDAVDWYHEFDFGNGLATRSRTPDIAGHRKIWSFTRQHLDAVDFRGKSVLDIGAWDGYWSFYAEKRGAERVLATDDRTQNWSDGSGIHLAKELFQSNIEINQDVSVYRLEELNNTFDVILFLGVYYHLFAPFYAFSQLRKCCHAGTVIAIEGAITYGLPADGALMNFADHTCEWLPTIGALRQVLRATYFHELGYAVMGEEKPTPPPLADGWLDWRWRLGACRDALRGSRHELHQRMESIAPEPLTPRADTRRIVMTCEARSGVEALHAYHPPFGLGAYDSRFRAKLAS